MVPAPLDSTLVAGPTQQTQYLFPVKLAELCSHAMQELEVWMCHGLFKH